MTRRRVDVYRSRDDLERAAQDVVLGIIRGALRDRGVCTLCLSGGETPRGLYRRLALLPESAAPDWGLIHLCFGDERMVPPDDPESNYGMVRDELIRWIRLPAGHVHRIRGERPPVVAAAEYAGDLGRTLSLSEGRFDCVLLGLGADGHTASLFPGTGVIREGEKTAAEIYVPALSAWRVTVTLPVINNARHVIFVVSGGNKNAIVRRILDAPAPDEAMPATLVNPSGGLLTWMLDGDAAAGLTRTGGSA